MASSRKYGYLPVLGAIVFLSFALLSSLYVMGYRLGKDFSIVTAGGVVIEVPKAGSNVYLDALKKRTTKRDNETVSFRSLYPKQYTIIVSKDGFYPWSKEVRVEEDRTIHLRPFLIRNTISGAIITEEDPEYEKLVSIIASNTLPTASNKKVSKDGMVTLWYERGSVYAEYQGDEKTIPQPFCSASSCSRKVAVLTPAVPLHNLDFYEDRNDIIVASAGDTVFAMEIDRSGSQNFQPLYRGATPRFGKTEAGFFVRDAATLMQLFL